GRELGELVLAEQLLAQLALVLGDLLLDFFVTRRLVHVLEIALQEVVNRLDADLDRAGRFVLVDVLEREVRRAGPLDDPFDRRIVAALERRELERHEIWMPGGELRRPYLVVRAGRIAVLPDVLDLESMGESPAANLVPEQPFEQVLVERQRALREHRIPELLELLEDLVIQPRIVVIRPREDDDPDPVLALELIDDRARTAADVRLVRLELAEADLDGTRVLLGRQAEQRLQRLKELLPEELVIGEVDQRIQIDDALFAEHVGFLGERRLDRLRRDGDRRTRVRSLQLDER